MTAPAWPLDSMVDCPRCFVPIALRSLKPRILVAICAKCGFRYSFSTEQVRERLVTKVSGDYSLALIRLPTVIRSWVVKFELRRILRGRANNEVVQVQDHQSGQTTIVRQPGFLWTARARKGVLVAGIAAWFLTVAAASNAESWALSALVLTIPVLVCFAYFTFPRFLLRLFRAQEAERTQVEHYQDLLAKKRQLSAERLGPLIDTIEKEAQLERIKALVQRMHSVDASLYANRISRLQSVLAILERQTAVNQALEAEYDRADSMLDVELEAWTVAADLDRSSSTALEDRLADLRAMRNEVADLERQLAASDEIDHLLARE